MMMMRRNNLKPAIFVRTVDLRPDSDVRLVKLSASVAYGYEEEQSETNYVVISALPRAFDTGRAETYIFPADKDGNVLSWGELPGSYRGGTDHDKALAGLGFYIAD
jgi:hypothetical protein